MAAVSVVPPFELPDWSQHSREEGETYLSFVEQFVAQKKGKRYVLKSRSGSGFKLRLAGVDDTRYRESAEQVNGWGKFYLPQVVSMRVFGVVEDTSCPCDQLVLMTCEDKKVYAYDGEELHEVASDLDELRAKGLEYPASKRYYNGEAFKDTTEREWAEVRKGAVGQKMEKKHQELVQANKSKFLDSLD